MPASSKLDRFENRFATHKLMISMVLFHSIVVLLVEKDVYVLLL